MIRLPNGGRDACFDEKDLIAYIKKSGRDYIIQGQQDCGLFVHTKEHSLDFWLRVNFADDPETEQAVDEVIDQLIQMGLFEKDDNLRCPDSGELCKGIRLKR